MTDGISAGRIALRVRGDVAAAALMLAMLAVGGATHAQDAAPEPETTEPVYELRTYTAQPGALDRLVDSFGETVSGLLEKHGMEVVGFWTPADVADERFVYMLRHPDAGARDAAWAAFYADPELQALLAEPESEAAMPAEMNSLLLDPTGYSPLQ